MGTEPDLETSAWPRYRDNLPRHLIGIARDLQHRLMEHLVAERGHPGLRPSFGVLVTQVVRAPRPIAALAEELGTSVQATSQLVGLAERAGYLERRPGGRGERARSIFLSEAGERLVADGVERLLALERQQAERVGEEDHRRFLSALAALAQLQIQSSSTKRRRPALPMFSPAQSTVGVIPSLAAHVEQRLMAATGRRGHEGLKLSHSPILTLIGPSGVRLHRLADLHRVSRQAISAVARDLEQLGYLAREADPKDRRGIVVRLTERGEALIASSVDATHALETEWRALLPPEDFGALVRVARTLYAELTIETEILMDAFATEPSRRARADEDERAAADPEELARFARLLRHRFGAQGAARLAAHLSTNVVLSADA